MNLDINYPNVAAEKTFSKATRSIAKYLMTVPYISVGEFLQNISDTDLDELVNVANRDDDDAVSELMMLAEMLSRAEGVFTETPEEYGENVGFIRMLLASVSLARKGLVKVNYENISFSRDMLSKVIVEKI
jgi:hypothetical protein